MSEIREMDDIDIKIQRHEIELIRDGVETIIDYIFDIDVYNMENIDECSLDYAINGFNLRNSSIVIHIMTVFELMVSDFSIEKELLRKFKKLWSNLFHEFEYCVFHGGYSYKIIVGHNVSVVSASDIFDFYKEVINRC